MLMVVDVARLLNVHTNTVRRWTNCGVLTVYRIGPRSDRRFYKKDIDAFVASGGYWSKKHEGKGLSGSKVPP
jgi:excisionase family DNA binding protein